MSAASNSAENKGENHVDYLDEQAYSEGMRRKKNPHAVALSKLGAKKGGHARAASLTAAQRREIAQKAAKTRWAKKRDSTQKAP
jgi:hypothetical protein